jgi:uncharacterized membrane protein YdjX (TVP38/TMEM64 family)
VLLVAIVLAVPIVPFLMFGPRLEGWIDARLQEHLPPTVVAGATVALLAVDILLPIPSSVVSTVAAHRLGFWLGTACSWLGMTLGATVAFLAARLLGRAIVLRLSRQEDLERADRLGQRYGPAILVLARAIPVLAEASVLLLATSNLPTRRFVLPVALSNLGIATAYSALGCSLSLPVAVAASIALPVAATIVARSWGCCGGGR